MQTQAQKTGELLGEVQGKRVSITIRHITPWGVRMEVNNQGQFAGSKYIASHMETVNVSQNYDGTAEWEAKAVETTPEGDIVALHGRGKGRVTGPTTISADGEIEFTTKSPKLDWLNKTKARVEITANNTTGEFDYKVYTR